MPDDARNLRGDRCGRRNRQSPRRHQSVAVRLVTTANHPRCPVDQIHGPTNRAHGEPTTGAPQALADKRPTNPFPASLVSLVAGVFQSPNFFPTQVMVRSEQWWRRLFADLSSQGGRCGSVVRWRVFTCRRSIGGRIGLRIERFHSGLIGQRP